MLGLADIGICGLIREKEKSKVSQLADKPFRQGELRNARAADSLDVLMHNSDSIVSAPGERSLKVDVLRMALLDDSDDQALRKIHVPKRLSCSQSTTALTGTSRSRGARSSSLASSHSDSLSMLAPQLTNSIDSQVAKVLGAALGGTDGHCSRGVHSSAAITDRSWCRSTTSLTSTLDDSSWAEDLLPSQQVAETEADMPYDHEVACMLSSALVGASGFRCASNERKAEALKPNFSTHYGGAFESERCSRGSSSSSLLIDSGKESLDVYPSQPPEVSQSEADLPFDDEVARVLGNALVRSDRHHHTQCRPREPGHVSFQLVVGC